MVHKTMFLEPKHKDTDVLSLKNTPKDKVELLQTLSYLEVYPKHKRQLLIDISGIKRYNSKTGIPRVVLKQLEALQSLKQDLFEVRAIYLSEYPSTLPLHFYEDTHTPISLQNADIIYNPDLDPQSVKEASIHKLYNSYKNIGVYIVTLIHDILPITHPHFFVKGQDQIHKEWLTHILAYSDLLITTSDETKTALQNYKTIKQPVYTIALGATSFVPSQKNTSNKSATNFLVVSTIEPRKGHAQLLDAFELLWQEGFDAQLTIVGKQGWNVEKLMERINTHPQKDKKLHYKAFVEDSILQELYQNASALIVPSFAEGFGLPLIEAAHYHTPIIARNISVFHEIADNAAFYFSDTEDAQLLANTIKEWYALYQEDSHPKSDTLSFSTWDENVKKIFHVLCEVFEVTPT